MSEVKDLSIIIVNYKSKRYLSKCIASIYDKISSLLNFEIIVVSSDDEKLESFQDDRVRIVGQGENLGFGCGNNLGAQGARGKYFMFLNPDTEVLSQGLDRLLERFEKDASLGIIGPKLLTEKEEVQWWSAGREITLVDTILNNLGITRSKKVWNSSQETTVDWVSGCAMIIPRQVFESLGGFDEKFFMYFEDIDLCRRVRKMGKRILYIPYFNVKHLGGGSSQGERQQKESFYSSQDYYFQKHFGKFQAVILGALRRIVVGK